MLIDLIILTPQYFNKRTNYVLKKPPKRASIRYPTGTPQFLNKPHDTTSN